jgi:hypothetical protein
MTLSRTTVLAALATGLCLPAPETRAADWEWTIAPYLWAADVSLDVTANDEPVIGSDIAFADILDKTELALMAHFEGRTGKTGFFVDALYLSVSDDRTTAPDPPLPGGTRIHAELDMGTYEAGGFYRVLGQGRALDVLLGARLLDVEQAHDIAYPPPSMTMTTVGTSDSLLDAFAGLRYGQPLGGRVNFAVRADVGAGGTDLTWNALGTLGVRLGETGKYNLGFSWKHMDLRMEEVGDNGVLVESDVTFSGPAVSFVIKL